MGRAKKQSTKGAGSTATEARPQPKSPGATIDRYDGTSFMGSPPTYKPSTSPDISTSRTQRRGT